MNNSTIGYLQRYFEDALSDNSGNDATLLYRPIMATDHFDYVVGNDSVIFKITSPRYPNTKALKIYLDGDKFKNSSFSHSSSFLRALPQVCVGDFEVLKPFCKLEQNDDEFLLLSGVIMDWKDGIMLSESLYNFCKRNQKENLKSLLDSLKQTIRLFRNGMVSGIDFDLDNFIVHSDSSLYLVDLDSWKSANNNATDDYKWLLLYVYILALSEKPEMYQEFGKRDIFFFTYASLRDPSNSKLIHDLKQIESVRPIVPYLLQYYNTQAEIPELEQILEQNFPIPKITLTQTPNVVLEGESVRLDWKCENVEELWIDENIYSNEITYLDITAELDQDISFLLKNSFQEFTQTYRTDVWGYPTIEKFELSKEKVQRNSSLTISWNCKYSKEQILKINGMEKEVDTSGTMDIVCLDDHYEISLQIIGLDGIRTDFISQSVLIFDPVNIEYFASNLPFQNAGHPFTLKWSVENAQYVQLSSDYGLEQEITTLEELKIQGLNYNATYTLTAKNAMFTESKVVKMNIVGLTPYLKPKFLNRKK